MKTEAPKQRKFRNIFFLKLVLIFSVILILSFIAILGYSSLFIEQRTMLQLENENIKAINTMQTYLREKNMVIKRIFVQLYSSRYYREILDYIAESSLTPAKQIEFQILIDDYMQLALASDNDIVNIALINENNDRMYYRTRGNLEMGDVTRL